MKFGLFFAFLFLPIIFSNAFAEEPILITVSSDIDQVVFDGKWTNSTEWKRSSYDKIKFSDLETIHLRTAHKENFVYIQINPIFDTSFDKDYDSATICFDTKNDKTTIFQFDDYCFSSTLDRKDSSTYQGVNNTLLNESLKIIPNSQDFIAIGGISDKHDRYSKTPHIVYEFKIPLEQIGRTDNYGFYFKIFDASTDKTYSWPDKIIKNGNILIPNPDQWGDLVSPDKSLPEFNFSSSIFLLIPTLIIIGIVTKFNFFKRNIVNY